jgi:hypothetical protein
MNCPHCHKTLWFVKDRCPFCKNPIAPKNDIDERGVHVETVGDVESSERVRWVTVKNCGTILEADTLRAQLEAAGIKCFIPDEQLMQTLPLHVPAFGHVRLQVDANDLTAASELVRSTAADASISSVPELPPHEVPLSMFKAIVAFMLPMMFCIGWIIFAIILRDYSMRGCTRKKKEWIRWFTGGFAFWFIALTFAVVRR